MTIKELAEDMMELITAHPEYSDYPVVMVGHDEDGWRVYNTELVDYTISLDDKVIRMWDD